MVAKGKITRIANCNEGGVKRKHQKKISRGREIEELRKIAREKGEKMEER